MKTKIHDGYDEISSSGSQRIREIYTENNKVWLELSYAYDTGMTLDEAKKFVEYLNKAIEIIENESNT